MDRLLRTLLSALAAVLLVVTAAAAQVGSTAQITGTVRDSSGAVLPGVDVARDSDPDRVRRAAVTESNGLFVLTNTPRRAVSGSKPCSPASARSGRPASCSR